MPQDEAVRDLARTLLDMAADANRVARLHGSLGEFCHMIRNRLNSLKLSLYLARRASHDLAADEWRAIDRDYQAIEQFLEQFQSICRPIRLNPIQLDVGIFLREKSQRWRGWLEDQGRTLELMGPEGPVRGIFDPSQIGIALDALMSWRSRESDPDAVTRLTWLPTGDDLTLMWAEVGRGGVRKPSADDGRLSLALPLVARILNAHGGVLDVGRGDAFLLRLRWPLTAVPSTVAIAATPNLRAHSTV